MCILYTSFYIQVPKLPFAITVQLLFYVRKRYTSLLHKR